MATTEQYANWIVANQDKKGTPEFETVAKAYKIARGQPVERVTEELKPQPITTIYDIPQVREKLGADGMAPYSQEDIIELFPNIEQGETESELVDTSTGQKFVIQLGAKPKEPSLLEKAKGVGEAALTVGTGAFGALASGIGTLDTILNQIKSGEIGSQEAADKVKAEAERLAAEYTYAPRTETGQEIVKTIGEVAAPLEAVAPQLATARILPMPDRIKTRVQQRKEMPSGEVAPEQQQTVQATKAAIDDLNQAVEAEGIQPPVTPDETKASWLFNFETPAKRKVREAIEKGGEPANITAGYTVEGSGKVKALPKAKDAIKAGYDQGVIASAQAASKTDKQAFKRMVDILEKGIESKEYAAKNRPSQVIGESILKRWDFAKQLNKKAGKDIDKAAEGLTGKSVDLKEQIGAFYDELGDLGVMFDDNNQPIFTGPEIDIPQSMQGTIEKIINRAKYVSARGDAKAAHKLKRFIDDNVSYGGKAGEGLKGYTERVVKNIRNAIDDQLDDNFPEYNQANTAYADSIEALNSFIDVAGRKNVDVTPKNARRAFGVLSRRLLSNVQSRGRLMDSIELLEEVGSKYGAKFDDNLYSQAIFIEELERMFGPSATTSLYGELAKAAGSAVMGDARTGAIGTVKAFLKPGSDQDKALKTIKAFLAESQ